MKGQQQLKTDKEVRYSGLIPAYDTGYTELCPYCCNRSGDKPELVGRSRMLDLVKCGACRKRSAEIIVAGYKKKTKLAMGLENGSQKEKSPQEVVRQKVLKKRREAEEAVAGSC